MVAYLIVRDAPCAFIQITHDHIDGFFAGRASESDVAPTIFAWCFGFVPSSGNIPRLALWAEKFSQSLCLHLLFPPVYTLASPARSGG